MIRRVTIHNMKRFERNSFELADSIVLAGPNNSGKSTLLQAIATWRLGLDWWLTHRKERKSRATRRTGVSIPRPSFTAVPLREMNLLWEDRRVSHGGGRRRLLDIVVDGGSEESPWTCGLEFEYANPELVYVRPHRPKELDDEEILAFPPAEAEALDVVHIPPLSGIERDEPRREQGLQNMLVGLGQPGDILRNLLWEIADQNEDDWKELVEYIRSIFNITLSKPSYSPGQPYIISEYQEVGRHRPLDLVNAGSGTLQVLLLFAFLYARKASVLLVDEPDAHQHIILQRQVYELLRKVANRRGAQFIIATHSTVLLDVTEPGRVISFYSEPPRALIDERQRDQVREAFKLLSTTDLLLGKGIQGVLYVEGESDEQILRAWAETLGHRAREYLQRPFVQCLQGRNTREARNHFFAMKAVIPQVKAICLLDGDNQEEPGDETERDGLTFISWHRYEIENYLLQPTAIKRFLGDLSLLDGIVDAEFRRQIPPDTDLFGDHVALTRIKASVEFLLPLLRKAGHSTPKRDLFLLAGEMTEEEIHPEVREKLDRIALLLAPFK